MSVKAIRVDDIDESKEPGAFEYFERDGRIAGMIFRCPCGCGDECAIDFRPAPSPSWEWDGNLDAPTLSPSVHRQFMRRDTGEQISHWHGWLQGGEWRA